MSLIAPGNGYQPFTIPASMAGKPLNEKTAEGDQSGGAGVGLTEKEIDERVRSLLPLWPDITHSDVSCRSRKLWKLL